MCGQLWWGVEDFGAGVEGLVLGAVLVFGAVLVLVVLVDVLDWVVLVAVLDPPGAAAAPAMPAATPPAPSAAVTSTALNMFDRFIGDGTSWMGEWCLLTHPSWAKALSRALGLCRSCV
jgi:hypothetical protein